jgi:Fe2+ transport system protein A
MRENLIRMWIAGPPAIHLDHEPTLDPLAAPARRWRAGDGRARRFRFGRHRRGALRRLGELGFLPGEPVQLLRRGPGGREPLAVLVGETMFALRLLEAQCIEVEGVQPLAAPSAR